jgi:hypothetical protein
VTAQQLAALLRKLEQHHGSIDFAEPTDPYELIVYTHCGYPPSQDNCRKGFEALRSSVGLSVEALLAASERSLAKALKAGASSRSCARRVWSSLPDSWSRISAHPASAAARKRAK